MNKKERMYQAIEKHGQDLVELFGLAKNTDTIKLCKSLFRLENKAHKLAEDYCNGTIDTDEWEMGSEKIYGSIDRILSPLSLYESHTDVPVFVNGDPRGYALKIDDTYIRNHNITIYRDLGGYGILAPDFRYIESGKVAI